MAWGHRCRPWRAPARRRSPPCRTPFFLASFYAILPANCSRDSDYRQLITRLRAMAEEPYRAFHSSLLPGVEGIMGIRLPLLSRVARELCKGDWRGYLAQAWDDSYEEIMLQALVIGLCRCDEPERIQYICAFVPKISNWAVCDTFCSRLTFARRCRETLYPLLRAYTGSQHKFEVRFGVVMLMDYYMDEAYVKQVLTVLQSIRHEGYYGRMAVAWALSVCYVKQPQPTLNLLKTEALDAFTHNKAIQKICESKRGDIRGKTRIKAMETMKAGIISRFFLFYRNQKILKNG